MNPPAGRGGPRKQATKTAATATTAARGGGPAQERELREQGKKTMRKLLDAGVTVFEKRGYHAARVDDIVKLARTSHGTFYLYFSSKEDLFKALLADVAEGFSRFAGELADVCPTPAGRKELHSWLTRFADYYADNAAVIRAWTEADLGTGEIATFGDEVLNGFAAMVEKRLEANGSAKALSLPAAATAAVAMVERFNYYSITGRVDISREEMVDTLTSILHVGLFGGERPARRSRKA